MPAIDDTPVITGPRLRQAIARQRSRNARVLSWVRAVGAVALAAVFVVYRNVSEWQDGVWLAAPYACIAIALAVDAQLSEAGTRRSWRAVPLLDVPVIAGLELLFVRFAPNPSALINFNSATLLLCVLGVALSLSLRLTVLTAVEAAAVHVALQVHTDSPLRHLAVTGVLFLLGAALGVVFSVAQTRLLKDSELQKAARRQTQDRAPQLGLRGDQARLAARRHALLFARRRAQGRLPPAPLHHRALPAPHRRQRPAIERPWPRRRATNGRVTGAGGARVRPRRGQALPCARDDAPERRARASSLKKRVSNHSVIGDAM